VNAEHTPPAGAFGWLIPGACAVALLHFGRPVLEPLAVAGILTLTLAPLVRRMRGLGLPHAAATFVSVGLVASCVLALGAIIATQLADVVRELPQYRAAVTAKLAQASAFIERPLEHFEADMSAVWPDNRERRTAAGGSPGADTLAPIPVEIRRPHPGAVATFSRLFSTMWGPVGEALIVFVLLLFMLLGRDSIRERVIRLTGEKEVAHTMQALADTDEGVSRFFASLAIVNTAFAAVSSIALALLGIPHALLWGTLAGAMRFVPYVGVPAAIAVVASFTAAVEPGWSLALWSIAVLVSLDVVLANVIEPHMYGHTMGIAPFGIVLAAVFWGALWGPVGLIVSAPLTLCLVVAGRHVAALAPVAIMLGESPGSTRAFLLYQRALAGETQDVLDDAGSYMRRHGLARYCDDVLLPAMALGSADMRAGRIGRRQDQRLRALLVRLVESLRGSWQGSPNVPARSVALCMGLDREQDELLTELLVRALRSARVDARSLIVQADKPAGELGNADMVSLLFVTYPDDESLPQWREACKALRSRLPQATVAAVKPPDGIHPRVPQECDVRQDVDIVLHSFSEALSLATRPADPVAESRASVLAEETP
jgi:predicted PurR-regulated permease PerM